MEKDYESLNLLQPESERDPFTEGRYRQFFKHLPTGTQSVLDIGCNTGRGGVILKSLDPGIKLYGLDAVKDRLDRLHKDVYEDEYTLFDQDPNEDGTYDAVVAESFIRAHLSADATNLVRFSGC